MSLAICCCSRWRCTVLRSSTVMMVDRRGPLSGPVRQTPPAQGPPEQTGPPGHGAKHTCGHSSIISHDGAKPCYAGRVNQKVAAMRKMHSADKSPHVGRDYLRPNEANAVIEAAGRVGRQRLRDQVLLRLMYRHGLRASEAKHTKWTDFDLTPGSGPKTFHVRRFKGSIDSDTRWTGTRCRPYGS